MTSEPAGDGTKQPTKKAATGFWGWVRRFTSFALFLLILGILIAPWIAARLISGEATEQWISAQIPGDLKIGGASMGWQSPIMLNDVSLSDESGKEILQVSAVTSNQSFWDLFRSPSGPIELEFEGLSAEITVPDMTETSSIR